MRINLSGENRQDSKVINLQFDLYDEYDETTDTGSMARTTGYTCTAVVNLLLDGGFNKQGVNAPENVGEGAGNLAYILKYLEERGVKYKITDN